MIYKLPDVSSDVETMPQELSLEELSNEFQTRFPKEILQKVGFENHPLGIIFHFESKTTKRTYLWRGEPVRDMLALSEYHI